jgi:AcrR family transcriptional regulator
MLVAARTLFVERGYSSTTMEAIAEQSDVGVATVYTYFKSKEGVFAELARMDMSELQAEGEAAMPSLPDDPVAAVLKLLRIYQRVHDYISYEVIREFTLGARTKGRIREVAVWVREWQVDQLQRALEQRKTASLVAQTLDTEEAAQVICDLLEKYYDRAATDEQERKALESLERRVSLIFEAWRP